MPYFSNSAVNRLTISNGMYMLSFNLAGNFFLVFLLSRGFSPVMVFLAFAAMLAARFVLRPMILVITPRIGAGKALVLGNFLVALNYVLLSHVDGLNMTFFAYCVVQALADCFYWMTYHAVYARMGDTANRGRQLGVRQIIIIATGIFAPFLGGLSLDHLGASVTFGIAAFIQILAILPLIGLPKLNFARQAPAGAFKAGLAPAQLFYTDSWQYVVIPCAWAIFMFGAAGNSFAAFGGALALAGLAGSVGTLFLGKLIDNGHAHHVAILNGFLLTLEAVIRIVSGRSFATMCGVTAVGSFLESFYMQTLMTAFYNQVARASCPFRCMFFCECGWDLGGISASLLAAGLLTLGAPYWSVFSLVFVAIAAQTTLLVRYYKSNLPIIP